MYLNTNVVVLGVEMTENALVVVIGMVVIIATAKHKERKHFMVVSVGVLDNRILFGQSSCTGRICYGDLKFVR